MTRVFRTEVVQTKAIDDVDLQVQDGEFVAIMGASGSGKTTLLNIIGLLDRPSSGSYNFCGSEVAQLPERARTEFRRDNIGIIFQSFNLIDELSVQENVDLALLYKGIKAPQRRKMVEETLERVGLDHRAGHFPKQLSGGQQQRVAIARAIVGNPKVLLADEPTGNLDSENGRQVMSLMSGLNANGTAIVMVTHSDEAAEAATRVVRMRDGRVIS